MLKIGEKVIVVENRHGFPWWKEKAEELKLSNWVDGKIPDQGSICLITDIIKHPDPSYEEVYIIVKEKTKQAYLMGGKGILKIVENPVEETND